MQESFFDDKGYVQPEMDADGTMIYSVEECVFLINETISQLGTVKVRGEISNLSISKGVMAFFDLKDAAGKEFVVQCSLFSWNFQRNRHLLEDGMEVIVRGKLKVYEKRGSLSLIIESMEPSGEGAWSKAFEALKKKLAAKGYFDTSRKRSIPEFVQKIGLITSEDGQALHDFQKNLGNYGFQVDVRPVWVEGDKAEKSIVKAIRWFNKNRPEVDVLVLIRGGGGFENLKVFHSEEIADEIVSSRIPLITGIGHEKDESIADFVADRFESTPTAVAAFLTRQREGLIRGVDVFQENMIAQLGSLIESETALVDSRAHEFQIAFARVLERYRFSLSQTTEKLHRNYGKIFEGFNNIKQRLIRLRYAYEQVLHNSAARVERASSSLTALNPDNVLWRGYSVVYTLPQGLRHAKDKKILKYAQEVNINDQIEVRLYKGKLLSRVEEKG